MRKPIIYTGTELLRLNIEPDKYLLDGFIWEKDVVMMLGDAKVGKSLFSLQLACALTTGENFLNEYEVPEACDVLYIQTEGKVEATKERIESMVKNDLVSFNSDRFHLYFQPFIQLNSTEGFNEVVTHLEAKNIRPKVIFIDPLYMSMGGDLSDNVAARLFCGSVRQLIEIYAAAVVINHHEHVAKRDMKGDVISEGDRAIMGSFVWRAFPDHVIAMRKAPDGYRMLSCSTQRGSRVIQNMKLELVSEDALYYRICGTADHPPYVDRVMEVMAEHGPLTAKELETSTGLSRSAIMKSLSILTRGTEPKIRKVNPGRRPVLYDVRVRVESTHLGVL